MTGMEFVKDALKPFCDYQLFEGQAAVTTHCLYPSNEAVTVYVTGGPEGARVSDEGGAIDVLSEHNRPVPNANRYLRRFCSAGLHVVEGKLSTTPVPTAQLTAAIMLVANASASAAHWGIEHLKGQQRRNIREELHSALKMRFPKERVQQDRYLVGNSNRRYRFDNVVSLKDDRLLVMDGVLRDPNSINSHTVAHIDLRETHDENIIQRIVYDEEEKWDAAELNLLQMAATLVPLAQLGESLSRISAS